MPVERRAPRCGLHVVFLEHSCDRARRYPVSEVKQLTLDALLTPPRVVSRHPHDQRDQLVGDWWLANMTVGVRPVPGDKATVPAKKGLGSHPERRQALSGQYPAQGCEPGPIGWLKARSWRGAAQNLELMSKHQDLDRIRVVPPEKKHSDR